MNKLWVILWKWRVNWRAVYWPGKRLACAWRSSCSIIRIRGHSLRALCLKNEISRCWFYVFGRLHVVEICVKHWSIPNIRKSKIHTDKVRIFCDRIIQWGSFDLVYFNNSKEAKKWQEYYLTHREQQYKLYMYVERYTCFKNGASNWCCNINVLTWNHKEI